MENPLRNGITTIIKHSESKTAWNVIGTTLGERYKYATIPYCKGINEIINTKEKAESLKIAMFISYSLNKH